MTNGRVDDIDYNALQFAQLHYICVYDALTWRFVGISDLYIACDRLYIFTVTYFCRVLADRNW